MEGSGEGGGGITAKKEKFPFQFLYSKLNLKKFRLIRTMNRKWGRGEGVCVDPRDGRKMQIFRTKIRVEKYGDNIYVRIQDVTIEGLREGEGWGKRAPRITRLTG